MVDIIPPLSPLTQAVATNELQAEGLDALGLSVPTFSPAWASSTPDNTAYDAAQMTLTLTNVRAPFRAILTLAGSTEASANIWSHANGAALTGSLAVLRLHPEAAQRLARLMAARYGDPLIYPVPIAMVVRNITPPDSGIGANWFLAGETLRWNVDGAPLNFGNAVVSFHDHRGLIIDPVAVAAIFADLIGTWPALRMSPGNALNESDAGGLDGIVSLASGDRAQVVDPHGWAYTPARDAGRLKIIDNEEVALAEITDGGLFDWQADQRIGRAEGDDPDPNPNRTDDDPPAPPKPLHWGWATHGTLEQTPLSRPELPEGVTLSRRFLRVMAVDLNWHLLGNRTAVEVANIPGDDQTTPDYALPHIRRAVPNFEYLVDGMAVMAAAHEMADSFPAEGPDLFALAVSPVIEPSVALPSGRWPAFPPPDNGAMLVAGTDPTQGLVGTWRGDSLDVILTIPTDAVPDGTHVRIFPRQFVEIRAIGEQPSFVRGDGGSAIALAGSDTRLLLINPFNTDSRPTPTAQLEVDIVLTSRTGQRRLFSVVPVTISGSQVWDETLDRFGGQAILDTHPLSTLLNTLSTQSIAPSPVFGIPTSLPPSAPNNNLPPIIRLVRQLASEGQPRQGPRFPTQARFETIFALGVGDPLQWNALLSGARWDWESRSANPELGNPGNPAGPDVHAAGIRCNGQLAYDLAFHALKRSQPILLPSVNDARFWFLTTAGDNWDAPDPDASGTVSAAMLETIAPFCDTPEFALFDSPIPPPGTNIDDSVVDPLVTALGLNHDDFNFEADNEAEMLLRLQREMATARFGQRDALWALRRAIGQAREFIYIESPAFARTAYGGDPAPYKIDLVEVIRDRLESNPRLKVVLCLPRLPDFSPERDNWVRTALTHRKTAIETLIAQAPDRVAAFHPIGFPGRSAVIRSTVAIVDDIWCMVGTSHIRRRGMTFDGAVDVVTIDREIRNGYASGIATFRQALMASKLGVEIPTGPANASSLLIRLAQPESAFGAIAHLLRQGGLGRCSPIWGGPTDELEQDIAIVDPDGVDDHSLLASLESLLLEG